MKKKVLASLLVIAVVAGLVGAGTWAQFSGTASNTNNVFTTGTVDIALTPATALFTVPNMAPGDSVTAELVVRNSGSLTLRYAMVENGVSGSGALEAQLQQTITTPGAVAGGGFSCDTPGAVLYNGPLQAAFFGNPAPGQQLGDRVLVSWPGLQEEEALCFRVSMPIDTDDAFEGLTVTVSYDFFAEQVVNNP